MLGTEGFLRTDCEIRLLTDQESKHSLLKFGWSNLKCQFLKPQFVRWAVPATCRILKIKREEREQGYICISDVRREVAHPTARDTGPPAAIPCDSRAKSLRQKAKHAFGDDLDLAV